MTPEERYFALSDEEITGLLWVARDPDVGLSAPEPLPAARALLAQQLIKRAEVQGALRYVLGPCAAEILATREKVRAKAQAKLGLPVLSVSIAEDLEGVGIRIFRGSEDGTMRDSLLLRPFPAGEGIGEGIGDDVKDLVLRWLEKQEREGDASGESTGFPAAPCCACGVAGSYRNILQLGVRAPTPGRGWGCVVCNLPTDGAVAVVCDECAAMRRPPTHACAGYPSAPERVALESLTEPFDHRSEHD